MRLHRNARLTPAGRWLLCERVIVHHWKVAAVAAAAGCSERTAQKWLRRYRDEGLAGLEDRSSRPHRIHATAADRVRAIEELRRLRMTSTHIAAALKMAVSTVGAVLARIGLNRLSRLEPPEPPNRYCRRHPGELIHVDIKRLGRFDRPGLPVGQRYAGYHTSAGAGFEYCHVAVDDTTRLAYVEILDDQKGPTCAGFLRRAVGFFAAFGVHVQRVMTDNGSGYRSKVHRATVDKLGIKHLRTRPYRPRTNGKAERFIQTMLREWAYVAVYPNSAQRRQALLPWLHCYNYQRPHGALGKRAPVTHLLSLNNLAGNDS
jgi:transposase InsO family protein